MSYDIEIVTHVEPEGSALTDLESKEWMVDGPFRVELSDLADPVLQSALAPRWLVQLMVPAAASGAALERAKRGARRLADRFDGVVYDTQEDRILWPRGSKRRYRAPAARQRIRVVNLEWFLPSSRNTPMLARRFLDLARKTCPEALPRRYGPFEPYQHRLEPGREDEFFGVWESLSRGPYGDLLTWSAQSPCFGGSVWFPGRTTEPPRHVSRNAVRATVLTSDFDSRALESDPKWAETIVTLFVQVATELGAFYATGYVERNVIAIRGGLGYDASSESVDIGGGWWEGLPSVPTWLAWFGPQYRDLVKSAVQEFVSQESREGLFLRLGEAPLDRTQLNDLFPRLPPDLARSKNDTATRIPPIE